MSAIDYTYYGADDDEHAKVAFFMTLFNQYRTRRVNYESNWEENAALAAPDYCGSFTYGRDQAPGSKRAQYQLDSSAQVASFRFASIVDWLVTPQNMMWSRVGFDDPELMKDRQVKEYCSKVSQILWNERYKAQANFVSQNAQNMHSLGLFGNMGMFIDEIDDYLDPSDRGLRYLATPVGEIYVITDHQRRVVGFVRHFRLTAQQAKNKFKKKIVPQIEAALAIGSQTLFDFLHFVKPRTDFNPFEFLTNKWFRYESTYISVQGFCILEEKGYRTLPLAYGRYMQFPDEDYGRGPTDMARPTLKTTNAITRVSLKHVHRTGDPTYLVYDTGLIDLKTHSGAIVGGAMSKDGKPLVGTLPTGDLKVSDEWLDRLSGFVKSCYLVDLFQQILGDPKDGKGMDARQMVEYVNERGVILFPTVGRQNTEYLGPLHDRELDILSWLRKLPPLPQAVREAKNSDVKMEYTNPIGLAMRGQKTAGFMRLTEMYGNAIKSGADPSIIDILDFDEAGPEIADDSFVPVNWITSPKKLDGIRKSRQQAAERERQTKELPGRAAIMKAQAISDKAQAGQNIGGTLSGTPEGGMPLMPGQDQQ